MPTHVSSDPVSTPELFCCHYALPKVNDNVRGAVSFICVSMHGNEVDSVFTESSSVCVCVCVSCVCVCVVCVCVCVCLCERVL